MSDEDDFLVKLMNSKLPYGKWLEEAYRSVMLNALEYVGAHGLPDDHHFFLTFRTDNPRVALPEDLKKKYPEEMTIVLQHQFYNLNVDRKHQIVSVELSFSGVRRKLTIPFSAITGFADPAIRMVFQFNPVSEEEEEENSEKKPSEEKEGDSQVISLDAFRKNKPKS